MEAKKKKALIAGGVVLTVILALLAFFLLRKPETADKYLDLGQKYLQELNYEQAVVAFTKAIEIDDKNVQAYLGRAEAYIGLGETEKAQQDIETARELDPELTAAWEEEHPFSETGEETEQLTYKWIVQPERGYDAVEQTTNSIEGVAAAQEYYGTAIFTEGNDSGLVNLDGQETYRSSEKLGWCFIHGYDNGDCLTPDGSIYASNAGHGGETGLRYEEKKGLTYYDEWGIFEERHPEKIALVQVTHCDLDYNVDNYFDLSAQGEIFEETGRWIVIDPNGTPVDGEQYLACRRQTGELSGGESSIAFQGSGKTGAAVQRQDGSWGWLDENGHFTNLGVEGIEDAQMLWDGAAAYKKDGKWGYLDSDGNVLIPCEFEDAAVMYQGRAWVKQNGKWGIIELGAEEEEGESEAEEESNVIYANADHGLIYREGPGQEYEKIGTFPKGTELTVLEQNEDGSWLKVQHEAAQGWVSAEYIRRPAKSEKTAYGNWTPDAENNLEDVRMLYAGMPLYQDFTGEGNTENFVTGEVLNTGYYLAKSNGKYGLIDTNGVWYQQPIYDSIEYGYQYGLTIESTKQMFDIQDGQLVDIGYGAPIWGTSGHNIVAWCKETNAFFYCGAGTGEVLNNDYKFKSSIGVQSRKIVRYDNSSLSYEYMGEFESKYFALATDSKLVSDFIYEDVRSMSDGLIAVKQDGKWGYANSKGTLVIPCKYDCMRTDQSEYGEDIERAEEEEISDQIKSYALNGNYATKCTYAFPADCTDGYVVLYNGSQYALYSSDGKEVIPFGAFENLTEVHEGKLWAKRNGQWGVLELA